jgi:hypothetical protein
LTGRRLLQSRLPLNDRPTNILVAAALSAALAGVAVLAGCASALHEAPPLIDLAGGGPAPAPGDVDTLMKEAAAAFERRDPESVRGSARLYLRAAAGDPSRTDAVIGAVRAQVWLVDHESDPKEREAIATRAVQAAQWCGPSGTPPPACSYWLGAALGVQARERTSTGVSALPQIEAAFRRAAETEPTLDQGAPDRALALLYLRAPGWPTGPGDKERGLLHARKAIEIGPDYPPNLMALAEALAATGDEKAGRETWETALARARDLAGRGDKDAAEWAEEAERAIRSPAGSGPSGGGA